MSASSDTALAHDVLRSIRQIMRRISEYSKHLSSEVGLTVPQLMCLKAIGELEEEGEKEITVVGVAARVHLSAATVSRILDRLVRDGLVTRERIAVDRRKVCLALTPSGIERFQSLPVPLQEQFVTRLSALPEQERVALLTALRKLSDLMEANEIDAAPLLHTGDLTVNPHVE